MFLLWEFVILGEISLKGFWIKTLVKRSQITEFSFERVLTRNSSGDEIANMNFLYDDIVHALQNTIDSCINSTTDRRGYVLKRRFT